MHASFVISYHTNPDAPWADALARALKREGVTGQKLDYLALSGFSLPDGPAGGHLRQDGWIEHFADLLSGSAGMVVLQSASSHGSETTPARGMWIEQQLAKQLRGALEDFVRVLPVPLQVAGAVASTAESWALGQLRELKPWIEERSHAGPPVLVRFESDAVNARQPYFNHEIAYGRNLAWFFISVLDLYDRVWHCRSCLATSDIWTATKCRPPGKCPACGYAGDAT